MNYTEITELALAYADRDDTGTVNRVDDFIKMVEAHIKTELHIRDMTTRATLAMDKTREYYCLPDDFGGLRDIEMYVPEEDGSKPLTSTTTLQYLNPEQMNDLEDSCIAYYTIIAQQLHVRPVQPEDNKVIEIVYYRNVPNLNSTAASNWISEKYPELYVNGIVMQISAFVKDAQAEQTWRAKFLDNLQRMEDHDWHDRWSGTPLQMRVG